MSGVLREYLSVVGERERLVRIEPEGDDLRIRIDGEEFLVSGCEAAPNGEICLLLNGRPQVVHVRTDPRGRYLVSLAGGEIAVELRDPLAARVKRPAGALIRQAREIELRAPMPGTVVAIQVKEGDEVEASAPLVVLEAMKMQNALTSPAHGVVKSVRVESGATVEADQLLLVLERRDPS
jgi:biotin carboxyl carrier protein